MTASPASVDELKQLARADLALLGFPNAPWITPTLPTDDPTLEDVLIVGGGQSGTMAAAALAWSGLRRVSVLDASPAGKEGPWTNYARMSELRTSKSAYGIDFNIPNLTVRRWYETRYGAEAWERLTRVGREDWKAYLDWYADVFDLRFENDRRVVNVDADPAGVAVTVEHAGVTEIRRARAVILATGFDGAGAWRAPAFVTEALPEHRYSHTNQPLDIDRLRGKRIGVLGHGASAFDNAIHALEHGAESVDLCFRRDKLPRTNPHRALENSALLGNFPELADLVKWRIVRYFRENDQPPAVRSFETAMKMPGFRLRPSTPWLEVRETATGVEVTMPRGRLEFDHLLLATGLIVDLEARAELTSLRDRVWLWRDKFAAPAGEEDSRLEQLPYLDSHYGFQPRDDNEAWVRRVFAFNSSSIANHGPHSTSISGQRHCLPRLVRGVERSLVLDNEDRIVSSLRAYRSADLPASDDFEQRLIDEELAAAAE